MLHRIQRPRSVHWNKLNAAPGPRMFWIFFVTLFSRFPAFSWFCPKKKKLGRVVLLVHFVVSLEQFCCTNLLRITSVFVVPSIVYKLCVLFPDSLYYLTFFQHKHFFYYIWSFRKSLVVFHHFSYLSAFCVHKPRREKSHK